MENNENILKELSSKKEGILTKKLDNFFEYLRLRTENLVHR